jgi:hypothetical protein
LDVKKVMRKTVTALRRWACLFKEGNTLCLGEVVAQIKPRITQPLRIMREPCWSSAAPLTTSWESLQGSEVVSSSSPGASLVPDGVGFVVSAS